MTTSNRRRITPGSQYHRLTVVGLSHIRFSPAGARRSVFLCKCQCGTFSYVDGSNLTGQHPVKSCGCMNTERMEHLKKFGRTHGKGNTRTHRIWVNVVARGTGKEQPDKYFNRGITVCERWLSFENFYADMGECPEGLSIDRIKNDEGYYPGNCRYATSSQQARNTRNTWMIEIDGEMVCGADYADTHGVDPKHFRNRVKAMGWTVERALSEPINHKKNKRK